MAGDIGSCGLLVNGRIDCFDGAYTTPGVDKIPDGAVVTQFSVYKYHLCWTLEDGSIGCSLALPSSVAEERFVNVAAGGVRLSCGLLATAGSAGSVVCWDHFGDSNGLHWAPGELFESIGFGGNIGCGIVVADSTVRCGRLRGSTSGPKIL